MGVIFTYIAPPGETSIVLMDCSARWGQHLVRFTDFVAEECESPSIFLWNGEIISDFIYIDLQKMEELFTRASQNPSRLLVGWAEYMAGMLEIATKKRWGTEWKQEFNHFTPIHHGVDPADVPKF